MTSVMPRYLRALEPQVRMPKFPAMASLSYRQGWSLAIFLLFLFPLLFASNPADDPPIRYRTGTSEVRVSFFATDQNGHPLESVSKDDFAVVDSGRVIREFRSLARSNETVLDVVALIDTSESVAPRFRANLQHLVQVLDSESSISVDDISVIQFAGTQPAVVCSGNCRTAATEQRLAVMKAQGATPLYDAIRYTADFLLQRRSPDVRQVVILFSDGNDTISRASAREAFDGMLSSGALLYTVNVDSSAATSTGTVVLQRMAEASGGRSFSARDGIGNVLQAILADLRSSYVVSYSLPSRQGGFHSLRILPKHNLNLRFHCRGGYYYEQNR
jgi:Ca-activated chloride channel homolog